MINTKPLIKFSLWIITLLLICLIGSANVFADTVTLNGSVLNSTNYIVLPSGNRTLTFNGDTVYPDITDFPQYYLLTLCADNDKINAWYVNNSTLNTVNIYDTSFNCSFPNSSYTGGHIVYVYGKYNPTYQCNSSLMNCASNGSLTFNNPSSSSWALLSYQNSNENISIDYASNSIISQNQDIINQNQQIIQQNQQNTQDIINNNDTNTNKIIDENKKNFNSCRDSVNLLDMSYLTTQTINGVTITNNNGVITLNGTSTTGFAITTNHKIILSPGTYTHSVNQIKSGIYLSLNNVQDTMLYGSLNNLYKTFTISEETTYPTYVIFINSNITFNNYQIKPMLEKGSTATEYEPYGEEICVNKLDEQKNAINNLDDTLKNDNVDDNGIADAYEDFNDYLDDNSTITQLITLPITLYTAILNNLNGSCSPFNLGKLYGEDLILPCINISQYLGNSLWSMIDIIISGFAIYAISKKMIKVFNNFSSLREGDVIDD